MSRNGQEVSSIEDSQEVEPSMDFEHALDQLQEMFPEFPRPKLAQRLIKTSIFVLPRLQLQ
jgi:hypothetical protein